MSGIFIKRVYEKPSKADGLRILVDRIWPRGVSKEKAQLHSWKKEIAPTTELRKWYNHDPVKYRDFVKRYKKELQSEKSQEIVKEIRKLAKTNKVTLIFAAKDTEHSNALVLQKYLIHFHIIKPKNLTQVRSDFECF